MQSRLVIDSCFSWLLVIGHRPGLLNAAPAQQANSGDGNRAVRRGSRMSFIRLMENCGWTVLA
jgi:hypothetical protein